MTFIEYPVLSSRDLDIHSDTNMRGYERCNILFSRIYRVTLRLVFAYFYDLSRCQRS